MNTVERLEVEYKAGRDSRQFEVATLELDRSIYKARAEREYRCTKQCDEKIDRMREIFAIINDLVNTEKADEKSPWQHHNCMRLEAIQEWALKGKAAGELT